MMLYTGWQLQWLIIDPFWYSTALWGVARAGRSKYIPQILWDVITYPCPWCLILTQHSWTHWIARGNSIIIRGNTFVRATAKPSTVKWFHIVPPKYYSKATEMGNSADYKIFFRYFDDNYYRILIHHAWASQIHSNLLISGVKTLVLARVLTANQPIFVHL